MKNLATSTAAAFVFLAVIVLAPLAQAEVDGIVTKYTTEVSATDSSVTTATTKVSSTIEELLAQLTKLTALFNDLKAKMVGTKAEIKELRADIKEGMTDADIKTIQELLSSDPTIYPRGLVTGYFGPMTKEAVMKFQEKNGLEVTGEINEETRAAMDTIIEAKKADGKFPVGLLMAPGLKDKFFERFSSRCEKKVASSTVSMVCDKVMEKHQMHQEKKDMKDMKKKDEKMSSSTKMRPDNKDMKKKDGMTSSSTKMYTEMKDNKETDDSN